MLREAVTNSLELFVKFLDDYSDGNDFGAKYDEAAFNRPQVLFFSSLPFSV